MKNWFRQKLRHWLGINSQSIDIAGLSNDVSRIEKISRDATITAADVHMKHETFIIVASRLNGGYVKIIPMDFDGINNLRGWIKTCTRVSQDVILDAHPDLRHTLLYK